VIRPEAERMNLYAKNYRMSQSFGGQVAVRIRRPRVYTVHYCECSTASELIHACQCGEHWSIIMANMTL